MNITRGLRRLDHDTRTPVPPRCASMAVGSVPFVDPRAAVEFMLRHTPEIPAWPQLPRRSFLENMYVQFAEGLPGLVVDTVDERVWVRREIPPDDVITFMDRLGHDDPGLFAVSAEHAAGIPVLCERIQGSAPPFVKGQVTGPVSFGLTLTFEDRRAILYDETMREITVSLLAMKARWQQRLLERTAPDSTVMIVFDEPYLAQMGSAFVNLPDELWSRSLAEVLAPVECLAGLHVCGSADWKRVVDLPFDLLSFDAADHLDSVVTHAESVARFVGEGGLIAWGVIPNDARALETTARAAADRVLKGAESLAGTGATTLEDVLVGSFVSPACGTGALPQRVAERCFELAAETSALLREESAVLG